MPYPGDPEYFTVHWLMIGLNVPVPDLVHVFPAEQNRNLTGIFCAKTYFFALVFVVVLRNRTTWARAFVLVSLFLSLGKSGNRNNGT